MCPICRKPLTSPKATTCSGRCRQELFRRRNAERVAKVRALAVDIERALAGADPNAAAKATRELNRLAQELPAAR